MILQDIKTKEKTFSKEYTNIIKGIAILAMIFHHIYPNDPSATFSLANGFDIVGIVAASGKLCVSLLTILSGYGLSESFKARNPQGLVGNVKFVLSHLLQLFSMYWFVLIFGYVGWFLQGRTLTAFYGGGISCVVNMVLDIFGLGALTHTPVFVGGWFLSAIIIFYLIFPVFNYLAKKLKWF